jgi:hypothetical protein
MGDHGITHKRAYSQTAKDAARLEGDLQRQRARVAGELAQLAVEVRSGNRQMNTATLEAVRNAAGRLADLDEALRGS